jgi:hypothetical protein
MGVLIRCVHRVPLEGVGIVGPICGTSIIPEVRDVHSCRSLVVGSLDFGSW